MLRMATVALTLSIATSASAEEARELAVDATFTPGVLRANDGGTAFVIAATEWSGASDRVELAALGEVKVVGPLRVIVKVADAFRDTAKPGIGAGVKWLDEAKHGIASSAYLFYKTEGFTEPEGEIELVLAFGRKLGPIGTSLNLAYGQDPEGRERDGEVALAAQVEPRRGLFVGGTARYRDALGSRKETIIRDGFGGATGTVTFGRFAVTAMAGAAMIETKTAPRELGAAATLAIGAAF